MFSCDTMVVSAPYSAYGRNILAKNSDRPTGEPQPLCYYAGGEHAAGAQYWNRRRDMRIG